MRNYFICVPAPADTIFDCKVPKKGDRFLVTLTKHNGKLHETYGYEHLRISNNSEADPARYVIKEKGWVDIPRSSSTYRRKAFSFDSVPESPELEGGFQKFQIETPGVYWCSTYDTAVRVEFKGKEQAKKLPDFHVVKKGETLSSIAEHYYGYNGK